MRFAMMLRWTCDVPAAIVALAGVKQPALPARVVVAPLARVGAPRQLALRAHGVAQPQLEIASAGESRSRMRARGLPKRSACRQTAPARVRRRGSSRAS
jgi:hypothetical protein